MIYNLLVKVLVKNNMMIVKCLQDIIENTHNFIYLYIIHDSELKIKRLKHRWMTKIRVNSSLFSQFEKNIRVECLLEQLKVNPGTRL